MQNSSTLIGTVQDVSGTSISVALCNETATGLSFHQGESYRVGQVGSFICIPVGYTRLFGLVSQVGAGAAPSADSVNHPWGNQWLRVQLVGETGRGGRFERGVSQHPTINDPVHIVTESDLRDIYGPGDPIDFVSVGSLASAESIPALVNINKLITRHSAIVGTTGAGKSTTVAGILNSLSSARYPSARILVLDVHGEYAKALADKATVLRISPHEDEGERALKVPYWALNFDELTNLAFGTLSVEQRSFASQLVTEYKRAAFLKWPRPGLTIETVNADTPVPFSLHKLWFDLHCHEFQTVIPKPGTAEVQPAYVLDTSGKPIQKGDADTVVPPLYRTIKTTGTPQERVQWGPDPYNFRQEVSYLATRLRDPQLRFMFDPGSWRPTLDGECVKDLDALLEEWLGHKTPITILDLSGVPSTTLDDLVGGLLRIIYDALFWARNLPEGGRERPLLCVLEEAHVYLAKSANGAAASAVQRIAKEGRKYGVGMMLVSQRPSEIEPTILSQCGTIFAMRLANEIDRGQVSGAASDNLKGLFDMLPVLRTGEAIIVGEAVNLPIRALIDAPLSNRRPDSVDPQVVVRGDEAKGYEGEGGWAAKGIQESYEVVVRQWRAKSSRYEHVSKPNKESQEDGLD